MRSALRRGVASSLPFVIVASVTSGCANDLGGSTAVADTNDGGGLAVVASFYPLAEAAEAVGGDAVRVTNLTPPGVEPHDLELTPDQIDRIASADVVLFVGSGFQPAVEDAAAVVAEGETVDVLDGVSTQPPPFEDDGMEAEITADPHVWLSPVLMQDVVATIETALAQADPAGSASFRANAAAFDERLQALDREFRDGLAHCERDVIVTSHAAFGHLAAEYGLRQEAIAGLSPDEEPDARSLDVLATEIERNGTTTVYTEELVSAATAETIASETGATTAVLSPIEGLTPEQIDAGEGYASRMRANLAALREGLGCTA